MKARHCRKCFHFKTENADGVCMICREIDAVQIPSSPSAEIHPFKPPPNQAHVLVETAKRLREIANLSAGTAPENVTKDELLELVKDMGKLAGKIADLFDDAAKKNAGEN